jgi:hypothetical protein
MQAVPIHIYSGSAQFSVGSVHLFKRLFVYSGVALACPDLFRERAYNPSAHGRIMADCRVTLVLRLRRPNLHTTMRVFALPNRLWWKSKK